MNVRKEILHTIRQLSDEQLAALLPLALLMRNSQGNDLSSQTSQAYQEWVSTENDIYDETFADELAAR